MQTLTPEEFRLSDGRRLRLRAISPDDKEKMQASLAEQSAQTRYRRFMTDKRRLSGAELRYLTEVDGDHHFAVVVVEIDEAGRELQGVCVARYVELHDAPGTAEPAIVVSDAFQGLGIGRWVFSRLVDFARERGVRSFHCELLADNRRMLRILEDIAPVSQRHLEGAVLVMSFELADARPGGGPAAAFAT